MSDIDRSFKSGETSAASGPLTISEQGSFFVGGQMVQGEGVYDATAGRYTDKGNTFWINQMYVQYQKPLNPGKYPIVFVHGGSGTGRVWETTPDGREGFQSVFLRRGYSVYVVDMPRRGRSGYPSFNGAFGELDGKKIVEKSQRVGLQFAWGLWRLGPAYPEVFPVQQFPIESIDEFARHLVPDIRDAAASIDALVELLERIGPAILVTHSESGIYGWRVAARTKNVAGIVAYEPGYVFPQNEMPDPLSLYDGFQDAGIAIPVEEFERLASIPIEVVYGDNIPSEPVPDLPADGRRLQLVASRLFAEAINVRGGNASILSLPDAGLYGNTHFMFSDLNSLDVADLLSSFLKRNALDI